MSDLVLDNQRRREVSDALGMSFGRARAIRRLARRPMSMRELAARWASTRPTRPCSSTSSRPRASCAGGRIPPTGGPRSSRRRARARTLARRADAILATPPPALSALGAEDLEALRRILERARGPSE